MLKWVERLFVLAGLAALGWCAFVLGDAYVAQRQARLALESMSRVTPPSSSSSSSPRANPSIARPRPRPASGAPLAKLSIPRLGLSVMVLHGSDARTLRMGLGHIESTPLPGESGNVAVAGHRDTFFRPLRNVKVGDDIVLDTPEERVHYRVSWFRIVNARDVGVIGPTREPTLTLVTCYPFWFIGNAPDRFVVRASRVEDPAAGPPTLAVKAPSAPTREAVNPPPSQHVVLGGDHGPTPGPVGTSHDRRRSSDEALVRELAGRSNDRRGSSDEALVREAVERFRSTYNASLARHRRTGSDEVMTLSLCEVAVAGDTAKATCHGADQSRASLSPPLWTFSVDRIGGQWAVTTVGME